MPTFSIYLNQNTARFAYSTWQNISKYIYSCLLVEEGSDTPEFDDETDDAMDIYVLLKVHKESPDIDTSSRQCGIDSHIFGRSSS